METLKRFDNGKLLEKTLKITQMNYRPYDPGWYLYRSVFQYNKNKFTDEFIELVYVTLSAWNMNSRGARLNDFELFRKTIIQNKNTLLKLQNLTINDIDDAYTKNILEYLFFNLKLVYNDKPLLVTFSKFLHFYYPNLLVPIDRTYTLNYFFGNLSVPKKLERQFIKFIQIETEFSSFLKRNNLKKYLGNTWNLCETKIMDNMIIGYIKLNNQKRNQ